MKADPELMTKAAERGVKAACRAMGRRWDDEYLSEALLVAVKAERTFRQWKSTRDVYDYITYCVCRSIKEMIYKEWQRKQREIASEHLDRRPAVQIAPPLADKGDERLVASLASGNRVTGPSCRSRKVWEIRQARLKRLRGSYGEA